MKIEKTENGIKLILQTKWEKECIDSIAGKVLVAKFEDEWERKGSLRLEYEKHPWD